jgi:probable F420-dependent oxidoreductase
MRIGVVYPQVELRGDPEAVRKFGIAAEQIGYDHLLAYDHLVGAAQDREPKLWGHYDEHDPFHDPFMMFAHLAALTKRLEFVTGILVLPQRQTVLVAKQTTDLDLLSNERLRLGVGIGWNYVEYDALGQDFKTRGRRVDEQIGYLRRLWTEELLTFEGKFDRIDRGCINPRPRRMIPIWIGGLSEPAYRRAGYQGEGFIFNSGSVEQHGLKEYFDRISERLARVQFFRKEAGREHLPFGTELQLRHADTNEEISDTIKRWEDLGGTHVSLRTMGKGFKTVEQHIDYMADVKRHLDGGR